jgi:hypothetical protein
MKNTYTTWADGFGNWHCKVSLGTKAPSDALNINSIRSSARRAMKREIEARQHKGSPWPLRIEISDNELDSMNRMWSLTFSEKTS